MRKIMQTVKNTRMICTLTRALRREAEAMGHFSSFRSLSRY